MDNPCDEVDHVFSAHPCSETLVAADPAVADDLLSDGADSAELLEKIVLLSHDGILVCDAAGRVRLFNEAASRMFAWAPAEILGEPLDRLIPERFRPGHGGLVRGFAAEREDARSMSQRPEVVGRRRDGSEFPMEISLSKFRFRDEMMFAAIMRDVTQRHAIEAELRHLATTDPLTGVANRRHFLDEAGQELARARRYGRELALIVIDIDHFKAVNDRHGHASGDRVLRGFAEVVCGRLRGSDTVGRLGGEEFAVLLPETTPADAAVLAERMRRRLAETAIPTDGDALRITASFGVAALEAADGDVDSILVRADAALYRAKEQGRNRVVAA